MIADDMTVYAVDRNAEVAVIWLQEHLDAYGKWADKWRVSINAAKSKAIVFSRLRKLLPRLYTGDTRIPWYRGVKYLAL